jgi:hypothetical protein
MPLNLGDVAPIISSRWRGVLTGDLAGLVKMASKAYNPLTYLINSLFLGDKA